MGEHNIFKTLLILSVLIGIGVAAYCVNFKTDSDIAKQISDLFKSGSDKQINGVILGTDEGGTRTDFIMFASYNPKVKKIKMISIPRDTRVPNSNDRKINSLYQKGKEELVVKDVEYLLNVPVEYYATVNLKVFRELVDEIGGIPMNVPMNMNYYDPWQNLSINISKGYQVLDGSKAEGFVRYRSGYATADLGRIEAQHEFINAAIAQLKKPENITKFPSLIKIVSNNVRTNMSAAEMLKYSGDISKINKESVIIERIPGEPKYISGISYFVHDKEKTQQMVDNMFTNQEEVEDSVALERNKTLKVEIFNGTNTPGLASKVSDNLKEKGFNVIRVDNWDSIVKETKIYEKSRKAEGSYVKNVLKVGQISAEYSSSSDVDYTVILGLDYMR